MEILIEENTTLTENDESSNVESSDDSELHFSECRQKQTKKSEGKSVRCVIHILVKF